jgi:hypothetical protein
VDGDGVRVVRDCGGKRYPWLVIAAAIGVTGILIVGRQHRVTETPPAVAVPLTRDVVAVADGRSGPAAPTPVSDSAATLPESPRRRQMLARRLARRLPRTYGPEGKPELSAKDAIAALRAAGIRDGIAVFPPPGTDPPKRGIVVPDDWVLPEGYVRHYQTTDEGESLPPILMLHPDYEFVDENGDPVAAPEDRVVPPELAPPGLPVRMLDIPGRGTGSLP